MLWLPMQPTDEKKVSRHLNYVAFMVLHAAIGRPFPAYQINQKITKSPHSDTKILIKGA